MLLLQLFRSAPVIKSSGWLLSARLWVFSAAWAQLVVAAVVILPADMSVDENPKVRAYQRLKWRFITAWFNLINLAYLPVCIYCDWKEKNGEEKEGLVSKLRRIRDVIFTSILFPTVMYADTLFWRLYYKDPELISPVALFKYMPGWGQHSLHTISLVAVVLDLLLVPRQRPQSLKPRLMLMTAFFLTYFLAVLQCYLQGEAVYQLLENLSQIKTLLLVVLFYIEYLFFFFLQWLVIDCVWKKSVKRNRLKGA